MTKRHYKTASGGRSDPWKPFSVTIADLEQRIDELECENIELLDRMREFTDGPLSGTVDLVLMDKHGNRRRICKLDEGSVIRSVYVTTDDGTFQVNFMKGLP